MNFSLEYTKEQEEFAKEVRQWLDENITDPLVHPKDTFKITEEQFRQREHVRLKLGQKGWLHPGMPPEYGGGGLDVDHRYVLIEELAKKNCSVNDGAGLAEPAIMAYGTEEQKKRFLPLIFRGEADYWQVFTEPEAGSDEANQKTNAFRAVREKDYFIVNGSKIFIGGTAFPVPKYFWLLTRCDLEASRHGNLAAFFVPSDLPGITVQRMDLLSPGTYYQTTGKLGSAPGTKHSIFFDDVKIHESYLIGEERQGWNVANASLESEHGGGGSAAIVRNVMAEKLLDQCKSNPNIAKRLRENPQLLDSVMNIYIGAQIERLFSMRNVWLSSSGKRIPYAGPQLMLYRKLLGNRVIADIAKVLGPYTLTDDSEWGLDEGNFELVERAGLLTSPSGTPEIYGVIISRSLGIGR